MASPKLVDIKSRQRHKTSDSPIVRGKFPNQQENYRKPAILKINSVLAIGLLITILSSILSYMTVLAKESNVKKLHADTNKLNYENIELQNKVDYLKSFYYLDNKVQKLDFLKKPEQIIEVPSYTKIPVLPAKKKKLEDEVSTVPGF